MIKVVTAEQMGKIDRLTTERFGVPSIELMENAATAVVDVILQELDGSFEGKSAVVLCGTGNNGGDGAAIARLIKAAGGEVFPLLLGKVENTKGDARVNFDRLIDECRFAREDIEVSNQDEINEFWLSRRSSKNKLGLIVDAVFGTGLHRPVKGIFELFLDSAIDYFHEISPPPLMVSVDLPSGIDSDRATPIGYNFDPQVTVTFTSPKLANVLPPAANEQGKLIVKEIGSPQELIDETTSLTFLAEAQDVRDWMSSTAFSSDSYKKSRGSVLIAAGSKKYSGAAVLSANGAMRSGAGIVTAAVPRSAFSAVAERVLPEVMVREVSDTEVGTFGVNSYGGIEDLVRGSHTVLVGCGIAMENGVTEFVQTLIARRLQPLVIDADGLNAISPISVEGIEEAPLILTPHIGEFKRLAGIENEISDDKRVEVLRGFAVDNQVICVLKGERTLIASPEGVVVVNPTGNPGLGKAGNGDNLAGIISGFVAQTVVARDSMSGNDVEEEVFGAVVAAVYVAGLAGDIAAEKFGNRVMTASDVRECLTDAFRSI
ncbi:MAG: NAD(P)H-hydrate dehydratase [Pyrinomonadaceae bacterium]|nr:NAD(P)H-hydrate dehydratase [Pyrinomonadaceae bacterium]